MLIYLVTYLINQLINLIFFYLFNFHKDITILIIKSILINTKIDLFHISNTFIS